MAKVELDMSEFQDMLNKQKELSSEIARLTKEYTQGKLTSEPQLPLAIEALRSAKSVIGFAISRMHYDDVVGWPWQDLDKLCSLFLDLPGTEENDREWCRDTKSFSRGAKLREEERATRQPGDKPKPINL